VAAVDDGGADCRGARETGTTTVKRRTNRIRRREQQLQNLAIILLLPAKEGAVVHAIYMLATNSSSDLDLDHDDPWLI
jgi:hypothetical protein